MNYSNILFTIGNLSQATSMLLIFAAILFVFLLLLIVITIKVFKSGKDSEDYRGRQDEDDADDDEDEEPEKDSSDPFPPTFKVDNDEEDESEEGTTVLSDSNPDIRKIVEETQAAVDQAIASERTEAMIKEEKRKAEQAQQEKKAEKRQDNTLDFAEVRRRLAEQEGTEEEDSFEPDMTDYDISRDSAFASDEDGIPDDDRVFETEDMGEEPTTVMDGPAFRDPDLDDDEDEDYEDEDYGNEKPAEESADVPFDEDQVTFGEQMSLDEYLAEQPAEQPEEQPVESLSYETPGAKASAGGKITVNPVNAVNIQTVNSVAPVNTINPEAGITDMHEMEDFLTENPVPKKSKKKIKKKDAKYEARFGSKEGEIQGARYFWYNSQDIEGLSRKEDMYFYCHYFEQPEKAVMALVTEMYDCGFVRTEEIQKIAFGIQFRSMGMKEILNARDNISFDKEKAVKTPSEKDKSEIRRKWKEYVDQFLGIIVFNAPGDVQAVIRDRLYEYGNREPEVLIFSPQ